MNSQEYPREFFESWILSQETALQIMKVIGSCVSSKLCDWTVFFQLSRFECPRSK